MRLYGRKPDQIPRARTQERSDLSPIGKVWQDDELSGQSRVQPLEIAQKPLHAMNPHTIRNLVFLKRPTDSSMEKRSRGAKFGR